MNQNEGAQKENCKYESITTPVMLNEHLNPGNIIKPVIITVIIISVMSLYTFFERKIIIHNTEQITTQLTEHIAGNIDSKVNFAKSSIKFVSSAISSSLTSPILENPTAVIEPLIENSPFDNIEYIRADGLNVMNIGEPFNASNRPYYIEGIKGNTGVWNNYHPKTSKETLMDFYTPIYYKDQIAGVIAGYIAATKQITPLFEKKIFEQEIYGLLVDEKEMVICSTMEMEYEPDLTMEDFLNRFELSEKKKSQVFEIIHKSTEKAAFYKDSDGQGRISVSKLPNTDWKVMLIIPESSFNEIISNNTKNSIFAISIISLLLITYGTSILLKHIKRNKEIALINAQLEKENRIFNEENKRAFNEISAIRDIIASANMGIWRIELIDGQKPQMFVDNTMKKLLGIQDKNLTPEETFDYWFSNISQEALPELEKSLTKMESNKFNEVTYLWKHPQKGERYVRCGGTTQKITGRHLLGGYHYDVDEAVREDLAKVQMLQKTLEEKNDYYNTLGTLARMFNSLHVIDLLEDTVIEYNATKEIKDIVNHKTGAAEMMFQAMSHLTTDECREKALEYTDFKTLPDRMQNKKFITSQFIGKNIGWFIASFTTMDTDKDGKPTKVVFSTQNINEKKINEEKLIYKTRTDELTGLLNRRAYEEDIYQQKDAPLKDDFVSMALDVNGLKLVNDNYGHAAGDELLVGASQCMKESLAPYGNLYRTGGDEFIAILYCKKEKLEEILKDFDNRMNNWKGKLISSLSISYGFASRAEEAGKSVRELASIADKRMYESKSAYYRKKGLDRRGHKDITKALFQLYTKILRINLSEDNYQIINIEESEKTPEKGFSNKLSTWFSSFAEQGLINPDDLTEYKEKMNLQYMKDYFENNKNSLKIFYKRKIKDEFKQVMTEIIPGNDYSQNNQILYLYIKEID